MLIPTKKLDSWIVFLLWNNNSIYDSAEQQGTKTKIYLFLENIKCSLSSDSEIEQESVMGIDIDTVLVL